MEGNDAITFRKNTNEELLELFLKHFSKTGKTPTTRDYRAMGISAKQVCKIYGSHNNAVIAAGLPLNKKPPHVDSENDAMLDGYIEGSWDKGAPLYADEINRASGLYSSSVYSIIFGGMNGLRIAAGFQPSPVDRTRYQKEDVQRRLKEEVAKVGRPLKAREINDNPNLPSVTTVLKSFGTTSLYNVWHMIGIA
ncbi:homing endonuclease associated repeat-containing protein [Ruminiclostridium cellobioparum]|uniref:homing endonuclease associated repeat-containing protein n=1 Tax=Ruminiclostridium cellobioparum TaxID=29355 RepID=UPI000483357C|nr:hypothetical protein [Ruminiclostridium cellobioparum]